MYFVMVPTAAECTCHFVILPVLLQKLYNTAVVVLILIIQSTTEHASHSYTRYIFTCMRMSVVFRRGEYRSNAKNVSTCVHGERNIYVPTPSRHSTKGTARKETLTDPARGWADPPPQRTPWNQTQCDAKAFKC